VEVVYVGYAGSGALARIFGKIFSNSNTCFNKNYVLSAQLVKNIQICWLKTVALIPIKFSLNRLLTQEFFLK